MLPLFVAALARFPFGPLRPYLLRPNPLDPRPIDSFCLALKN